jgi:truncated hemoglobin YjbI
MKAFASWLIPTILGLAMFGSVGFADEGSVSTSDLDARLDKALVETINMGATVYNRGDAAGCYWLYRGALGTTTPFLAHRGELQNSVMRGVAVADTLGTYDQRAVALRAVIDEIRTKIATAASKPLWVRLGGEPAVKAVVHDFVVKAAGDPEVDFLRGGKYSLDAAGLAHLEQTLVELVSAVAGGPLKYTGRAMKPVHAEMGITEQQFGALASDLIAVLRAYNVPKKDIDELVGLIATTKKDIVEGPKTIDPTSLWSRLGGEPAVKAVVHDFVAKAAADPKVDFTRGGKYPIDAAGVAHLEELLVQQISSVSGGPLKYSGKAMKPTHAGMGITEEQFGALANDLVEILNAYNVPKKEIDELVGIIATTKKDIVEDPK